MLKLKQNSFSHFAWRRRSSRALLGLVAGLAGMLAAPLQASAQTIPVSVGSDPAYVAFYVANQENLFKKHGVDVELLKFGAGGASLDAVMAGQGRISASAETSVIVRMGRGDMRAIGVVGESGANLKLVARAGITDPSQIKTYGVIPGGTIEYLTDLSIKKYGVDPAAVKIVNSGAPELPALLARGDIDGFWVFEPFAGISVKQGAKILARSADVGYSYNFLVTAMGPWLATNADDAKKILAALGEACDIVRADPQKAADAVRAEIKVPREITLAFLDEVECKMRDFSPEDFKSYDDVADFMERAKITANRVDYRKQLETGFYQPK